MKNIIQTINNNGILSSLVASVIFAGIVFFVTKAERKLVSKITFHDEVLNRQENPDFLLYYKDTLPIKNNLHLAHIEFWNEGTTPIRSEDLLEEIQIKLSDGKIIGNVEIEETHPKVIKAAVNYLDSGNALALRFNFLENTNGIKLRFYYVGEQKSNIKMDAYITGGNGVSNSSNPLELLLLLAILIIGMIGVFALFKVWKKNAPMLNDVIKSRGFFYTIVGFLNFFLIISIFIGLFIGVMKISIYIVDIIYPGSPFQ